MFPDEFPKSTDSTIISSLDSCSKTKISSKEIPAHADKQIAKANDIGIHIHILLINFIFQPFLLSSHKSDRNIVIISQKKSFFNNKL